MSTLSSSSTLAQVQDAYDDNASYEEDASVSKAKAFITAARILLRRYKTMVAHGGGTQVQHDLLRLQEEIDEAKRWIAQNNTTARTGGVKHATFANFRT